MAEKDEREAQRQALRGAEEELFDLVFEALPSHRRATFLEAPFQLALTRGNLGLVQKLMKAGAEIEGALHTAAYDGHQDIVAHLLESGASLRKSDTSDLNALHTAAGRGDAEIMRLLLVKAGADERDRADKLGWTPLSTAVRRRHLAVTQALLAAGADTSLTYGYSEKSVVHYAVKYKYVDVLRTLLEHGANANACTTDRTTPLHMAAKSNDAESIDLLVGAGANIEARSDDDDTPLHLAASNLNLEAVTALLKHGANVDAIDGHGETALFTTASYAGTPGVAEIVDVLLRSDADETIEDGDGNTPLDVTASRMDLGEIMSEHFNPVVELLENAPEDRAWRRRGFLVLCRAHPSRLSSGREIISTRTGSSRYKYDTVASAGMGGCSNGGTTSGACAVDDKTRGDWASVAARVLELKEEGIFRMVLGFL